MPNASERRSPAGDLAELRARFHAHHAAAVSGEGLRERKKRLTRKQISDTATAMFLERGFDAVRVSEVAEACGVSEKTVYNYFPNKETLLLDREDDVRRSIIAALGPDAPPGSPIDAFLAELTSHLDLFLDPGLSRRENEAVLRSMARFNELVEGTPSLRAAQRDMMDRLTRSAAEALAARAGVDPDDPEPQVAATAIMALWGVQVRALRRLVDSGLPASEVRAAVVSDVERAARLIDTGLWSFGLAVQGRATRQQVKAAAEAANEARKQVMLALKSAHDAWHEMAHGPAQELRAQAHDLKAQAKDLKAQAKAARAAADPRGRRGSR